jgi:hypothetical protein
MTTHRYAGVFVFVFRVPRFVFDFESCNFDRLRMKESNLYGMLQQELLAGSRGAETVHVATISRERNA